MRGDDRGHPDPIKEGEQRKARATIDTAPATRYAIAAVQKCVFPCRIFHRRIAGVRRLVLPRTAIDGGGRMKLEPISKNKTSSYFKPFRNEK